MKTHIFLILLALGISACASREEVSLTQENQQKQDHYSFTEGSASRFR